MNKAKWFIIAAVLVIIVGYVVGYITCKQYAVVKSSLTNSAVTPADSIVAQDSVSAPDSNTVQPKLTLAEQQRQARKAFFEKMNAARNAKNDARAKFEAKK